MRVLLSLHFYRWLTTSYNSDIPYPFHDCQLAFELDVKDCAHGDLEHPTHGVRPYPDLPPVEGEAVNRQDYALQHIYLDLRSAYMRFVRTHYNR